MRHATPEQFRGALALLGVADPPSTRGEPHNTRVAKLDAWKADVLDPAWKALVRENHPDRGGDTARMAEINAARDLLQRMVVKPLPEVRVEVNQSGATAGADDWMRYSDPFDPRTWPDPVAGGPWETMNANRARVGLPPLSREDAAAREASRERVKARLKRASASASAPEAASATAPPRDVWDDVERILRESGFTHRTDEQKRREEAAEAERYEREQRARVDRLKREEEILKAELTKAMDRRARAEAAVDPRRAPYASQVDIDGVMSGFEFDPIENMGDFRDPDLRGRRR